MLAVHSVDATIPSNLTVQGVKLNASLPMSVLDRLASYAAKAGMTKSGIVAASLDKWLSERGA